MKRIKLSQGQYTLVDNHNYKWLSQWKWYAAWNTNTQSFYAVRRSKKLRGKQHEIRMHREILSLVKGDKKQADHINHNTLDNRELNLRVVTYQQNQWNRKNTKGYYWNKRHKKYMAQIVVCGKQMNLGYFNTPEKARVAYLKAKEEVS